MENDGFVTVIGGTNVDIIGFPDSALVLRDSNPGKVKISAGGVGRNIGENLVRLGIHVKLISAIGKDLYGKKILEEAREIGIDMQHSLILKGYPTSSYMAILDHKKDMNLAIAQMDIFDKLSIDFIKQKKHIIKNAKVCVIDTNIPKDVIEYIVKNNDKTTFFLDTVSAAKSVKVKDCIGYFHTIKPNKMEAERLSGIKINSKKDLEAVAEYFLYKGVKRVFISLGTDGIYYNDGNRKNHLPAYSINVVNSTGAGDAFLAALVYCYYNGFDIDYSAKFAMAASLLALSHEDTINPEMSVENVKKLMRL